MGSLISSPKISTGTSTVRTVRVPVSSSDSSSGFQTTAEDIPAEEVVTSPDEVRKQNLLRRNRGRFGTVQTGFRGLDLASTAGRKSLLGE